MRDNTQLPTQQKKPVVKGYALMKGSSEYFGLGEGTLQLVTDYDIVQSQHYIEVFDQVQKDIFMRSRITPKSNFQRQKNTVILWQDPQQSLSNNLALSFQNPEICDVVWRSICTKIGKNYLEINGNETLQMPNQKNLSYILSKIENSYNLVAYHMIHSKEFMNALYNVFLAQKDKVIKNPKQQIVFIVREILTNRWDPKIMEGVFAEENFQKFLEIYSHDLKVNFNIYFQKAKETHQLVQLPEKTKRKIQIVERAKFFRECVIDYKIDSMLDSMTVQLIKDNEIQILINILQDKTIPKILKLFQEQKTKPKQQRQIVFRKIVTFFLQCVWILRTHHAQDTRNFFLKTFYGQGALKVLCQIISNGNHKALEILSCLAVLDDNEFLTQFTDNYRNDSTNNLVRSISRQFSQIDKEQFAEQTASFIKNLQQFLKGQDKKWFQFLNKTLILSIFCTCKFPQRILPIVEFYINSLGFLRAIYEHTFKYKFFQAISVKMAKKQLSKESIMTVISIIKSVVMTNKNQNGQKSNQQIKNLNNLIIKSNLFQQILKSFKSTSHQNNLVNSLIVNLIKTIAGVKYNQFTEEIKKFDFGSASNTNIKLIQVSLKNIKQMVNQEVKPEQQNHEQHDVIKKKHHKEILELQKQEKYLQQDIKQEQKLVQIKKSQDQLSKQLEIMKQSIRKIQQIKDEINKKTQQQQVQIKQQIKKRVQRIKAQREKKQQVQYKLEGLQQF